MQAPRQGTHVFLLETTKGLVTNYREGGLQNGRGGANEVLLLRKGGGGAEKVLAMLKGGHKQFRGSFYYIVGGGGSESFHSLKGGAQKVLPLPVINDQSLSKVPRVCTRDQSI